MAKANTRKTAGKRAKAKKKPATKKASAKRKSAKAKKKTGRAKNASRKAKKAKRTKSTTKVVRSRSGRTKISVLSAAAEILKRKRRPMRCKELLEAIGSAGLWKSPSGETPHQTLASAIASEIKKKSAVSRFVKTGRGLFDLKAKRGA